MSHATGIVTRELAKTDALKQARVHPFGLLLAQTTYAAGQGVKGDLTWSAVPQVTDALEDAFYNSFNYVWATGKRHYLAVDVSGSMSWDTSRIANTHIHAREGAACMAMVTMRTEPQSYVMAFADRLIDPGISKRDRLDAVVRKCVNAPAGGTDCSAPMRDALERNIPVDVFVVYTDNDTNSGQREHPIQALDRYRQKTGIPAKLAVVSMCANGHSIADLNDAGTLDIAGFDANCPALLAEFAGYLQVAISRSLAASLSPVPPLIDDDQTLTFSGALIGFTDTNVDMTGEASQCDLTTSMIGEAGWRESTPGEVHRSHHGLEIDAVRIPAREQ